VLRIVVALLALAGSVLGGRALLDRGDLSRADDRAFNAASGEVYAWCSARRAPAGGIRRYREAVDRLAAMAQRVPARQMRDHAENTHISVQETVIGTAQDEPFCARDGSYADRLRPLAAGLAMTRRYRGWRPALSDSEVRARLRRMGRPFALARHPGPPGTVLLRGYVSSNHHHGRIRFAVALGDRAALRVRAWPKPILPGAENRSVVHPYDGVDTAVVFDTRGLANQPAIEDPDRMDAGGPVEQQRRDLLYRVQWRLVDQVPP
jgi:hypothetical protein